MRGEYYDKLSTNRVISWVFVAAGGFIGPGWGGGCVGMFAKLLAYGALEYSISGFSVSSV